VKTDFLAVHFRRCACGVAAFLVAGCLGPSVLDSPLEQPEGGPPIQIPAPNTPAQPSDENPPIVVPDDETDIVIIPDIETDIGPSDETTDEQGLVDEGADEVVEVISDILTDILTNILTTGVSVTTATATQGS